MKVKLCTTVIVLLLSFSGHASGASEVSSHSFFSEKLGREYHYLAYTPETYSTTNAVYPTIYMLHGSHGSAKDWIESGNLKAEIDELISSGKIPPSLVFMPSSSGWWINGKQEQSDTAFIDDFIPHIEATWRSKARRDYRIIGGVSAGGYGAVNFALKYPELFSAALAFAPASYEGLPPSTSSAWKQSDFVKTSGAFDNELWKKVNYTNLIDTYTSQDFIVPFFIVSGDHDWLDIAYHSAVLYQRLRTHQPNHTELRILDGSHEWPVWIEALPSALQFAFKYISSEAEKKPKPNPFHPFLGVWTLKQNKFQYAENKNKFITLDIPNHITNCDTINTDQSILCIVDSPDLKGHIMWAYNKNSGSFHHLSHFGTQRLGEGLGIIHSNNDLEIKVSFSDEEPGSYRIYNYSWITENEYEMTSKQFDAKGRLTGNYYGGTFIRFNIEPH